MLHLLLKHQVKKHFAICKAKVQQRLHGERALCLVEETEEHLSVTRRISALFPAAQLPTPPATGKERRGTRKGRKVQQR